MDDPPVDPNDRIEELLRELADLTERARRIHDELRQQFDRRRRATATAQPEEDN